MVQIPEELEKRGLSYCLIVPRAKNPIEKEWQKRPHKATDQILVDHLANGGNYGVVCGEGGLVVIDFDNNDVQNEVCPKLPPTFTVMTGSGQLHKYFFSNNVTSFKLLDKNKDTLADIQGEGKQVIGPGSIHPNGNVYAVMDNAPIANIDYAELKALFANYLDAKDQPREKETHATSAAVEEIKKRIPISYFLDSKTIDTRKNPTNCPFHSSKGGKCFSFTDTIWHCFHCDESGDIFTLFMKDQKLTFKTTLKRLADSLGIKVDDKPIKKGKKGEEEDTAIYTSFYYDEPSHTMIEEIFDGKAAKFAVWDGTNVSYLTEIEFGGLVYKPIMGEEVPLRAILLPDGVEEYGDDDKLDTDILTFINKWLDIPKDFRQFALWNIKRSWVFDKFHTINYLRALGDFGQGKTRFLDTLGVLHYKPIMTSGATTAAPIFRIIQKWRGSMIFDEADFKHTEESEAIIKIINQGYEKGKYIMRCEKDNLANINFFDPYCPKVLATRKPFLDLAVESRCITAVMLGTRRKDIPLNLNADFNAESQKLRNKLLLWRFRNWALIDPTLKPDVDFSGLESRVLQIVGSFLALFSVDTAKMLKFREFIYAYQQELIDERADSWEGQIVGALYELIQTGEQYISAADIINKGELLGLNGKPATPRSLNSALKGLGFKGVKLQRIGDKVKRCLILEEEHLEGLFKRYPCNGVTVVTVDMGIGVNSYNELNEQKKGIFGEIGDKKSAIQKTIYQSGISSACSVTTVTSLQKPPQPEPELVEDSPSVPVATVATDAAVAAGATIAVTLPDAKQIILTKLKELIVPVKESDLYDELSYSTATALEFDMFYNALDALKAAGEIVDLPHGTWRILQ